ncbi:MAG: PQQ-binding-like beta-propeller repeat protein [Vicinamibacterales bacterium]|nr:PQQ-binding-like beta-propeller repeat protein [Vicinamibacterales bacterium]
MLRRFLRVAPVLVPVATLMLWMTMIVSGQTGVKNGEWPHWGGDAGGTKYSPLDQINRENVKNLRIAWRWKADNYGPRADANMEATPLMVGGVLYTTAGTRRAVVAIDGASGETIWMYRLDEGARADMAPRSVSRGVEYWTDGKEQRIILISKGYRLVSLDAKTGIPDPRFGKGGIVDLYEDFDQPLPRDGTIGSSSPAVVVKDVIVTGAALLAGTAPRSKQNTKGYVRGFDVRTGRRIWTFHTIPHPGEFGNDTWLNDSWSYTGNTAVWSPFSADEELGYVYLPVESATGDFYGGHRPGNNLFAGSLVCLDAKTGKRIWHQQLVHHDIWDYDLSSPPTLINVTVDGRAIRAVAQPTKWSYLFVYDRTNGKPVWPIEERSAAPGDTPGEWYSPTQPHPTKPLPYDRQGAQEQDLIDFTPELRAEALALTKDYRMGPLFTPPSVAVAGGLRGTLQIPGNQGSALWQGAAWDPETNMLYVPSVTNMSVQALQVGGTRSDMTYIGGAGGAVPQEGGGGAGAAGGARAAGPGPGAAPGGTNAGPAGAPGGAGGGARGGGAGGGGRGAGGPVVVGPGVSRGPWGIGPQGLPMVKPPYGRITAYSMNTGDIAWQVANGDTYDWIKTHPALKGLTIPKTGRADEGGIVVTKTLMFAGQGCGLFRSGNGGGPMFYAYDKKTGDVVHEMTLPGGTCGNPMTYSIAGKQYIAVSVGSRTSPAELIALALP